MASDSCHWQRFGSMLPSTRLAHEGVLMRRIYSTLAVPAAALAFLLAGCTSAGTPASGSSAAASAGGEKPQLTLAFETDVYGWDPSNQPGYQNWAAEAVWD